MNKTIELNTCQGAGEAERVRVSGVGVAWWAHLPDRSFYWFGGKASLLREVERINIALRKEEESDEGNRD